MLKKSLYIGTFFLLFIGLSDYGYGCHTGTKHKFPNADCGSGGGGSTGDEEGLYDVTIHMVLPFAGELEGKSNPDEPWGEGNRHLIAQNSVHQPDRVGELTDLRFFVNRFNMVTAGSGTNYFGDPPNPHFHDPPNHFLLHAASVKRGRGGRAEATLWFVAKTEDLSLTPLYALNLFGTFDEPLDWFPSNTVTLSMTDWVLHLENEGQDVKNISCLGEFVMEDDPFLVEIEVKLAP